MRSVRACRCASFVPRGEDPGADGKLPGVGGVDVLRELVRRLVTDRLTLCRDVDEDSRRPAATEPVDHAPRIPVLQCDDKRLDPVGRRTMDARTPPRAVGGGRRTATLVRMEVPAPATAADVVEPFPSNAADGAAVSGTDQDAPPPATLATAGTVDRRRRQGGRPGRSARSPRSVEAGHNRRRSKRALSYPTGLFASRLRAMRRPGHLSSGSLWAPNDRSLRRDQRRSRAPRTGGLADLHIDGLGFDQVVQHAARISHSATRVSRLTIEVAGSPVSRPAHAKDDYRAQLAGGER